MLAEEILLSILMKLVYRQPIGILGFRDLTATARSMLDRTLFTKTDFCITQ
jgi:hypothetical protein